MLYVMSRFCIKMCFLNSVGGPHCTDLSVYNFHKICIYNYFYENIYIMLLSCTEVILQPEMFIYFFYISLTAVCLAVPTHTN